MLPARLISSISSRPLPLNALPRSPTVLTSPVYPLSTLVWISSLSLSDTDSGSPPAPCVPSVPQITRSLILYLVLFRPSSYSLSSILLVVPLLGLKEREDEARFSLLFSSLSLFFLLSLSLSPLRTSSSRTCICVAKCPSLALFPPLSALKVGGVSTGRFSHSPLSLLLSTVHSPPTDHHHHAPLHLLPVKGPFIFNAPGHFIVPIVLQQYGPILDLFSNYSIAVDASTCEFGSFIIYLLLFSLQSQSYLQSGTSQKARSLSTHVSSQQNPPLHST